ncbi:hypothetical protein B0H16DRAFT_6032 [Mycena metata]|uniref:Uncharacterized protein n=1 Tax=Mycena metata TaxID=1033252 RepID=A0AAD7KIT9_9AGAR|nr:hypothetical protein B0H16DRAFT_6032 [Mycena metata]
MATSLPPFSIFLQPGTDESNIASRVDVTANSRYAPLAAAFSAVSHHLATTPLAVTIFLRLVITVWAQNDGAHDAFGPDPPTKDNIVQALITDLPDLVIFDIPDEGQSPDTYIRWGRVKRGISAISQRNEIYVHSELVDAFLAPNGSDTSLFHHVILLVTLSHETSHIIFKKLFTAAFDPPVQATPGDGGALGESDLNFENRFLGFVPTAILPPQGLNAQRLWNISSIVAETGSDTYSLSISKLQELVASFYNNGSFTFDSGTAPLANVPHGSVRYRSACQPVINPAITLLPRIGDWDRY